MVPRFLPLLVVFSVSLDAGCDRQQPPIASHATNDLAGPTARTKPPPSAPGPTAGEAKMYSEPEKRDLVVIRVFHAPVEQAWQAWSDPDLVMRWWGPTGFTCPVAKMDFREGGTSFVCMRAPKEFGGQDMHNTWTYEKIVPLNRFVYLLRFTDKDGHPTDPVKQGLSAEVPKEMRHEVKFRKLGKEESEVTVIEYGWTVGPMMENSKMGLEQCLDKMAALFAK
jgi:uncharacterized protein YndB with AHSA1/START domain